MTAVVLPTFQHPGLRIDRDALAVRPVSITDRKRVTHGTKIVEGPFAEAGLKIQPIWQILVMEARRIHGLLDVEAAF